MSRALVVSHSYYVRDTRFRRIAEALATGGWETEVLCARDEGEVPRERVGPVLVRRLPARRRRGSKGRYVFEYASFGAMVAAAVTGLHARRRYDLVYVLSIPNVLVLAAAGAKLRGARVILDVRDPMPEFFRSKYHLAEDHPAVRAMLAEERLACRWASHVVTVSDVMRDLLLRTGVPPNRISVIRNAPDRSIFGEPPAVPRDPADRTLLYAGTVATRYGVDLVVRAVAALRDEIPGIRARIVGDGDAVPLLDELRVELGVEDRVDLPGPVPLDAMPGLIASSWIGAQPHRDDPLMRFCFSTKVLEWAALGLPVVCARTPAFETLFTDAELTFIPPGDLDALCDRLREAHADPAGMAERTVRARAAAERLSWDRERETLLALVADGSGATAPI